MIRLSRSIVFNYSAPFSLVFSGEALRSRPAKRSTESNPIEFDSKTWTREREVFVGPLGMTRFFYFLSPFFFGDSANTIEDWKKSGSRRYGCRGSVNSFLSTALFIDRDSKRYRLNYQLNSDEMVAGDLSRRGTQVDANSSFPSEIFRNVSLSDRTKLNEGLLTFSMSRLEGISITMERKICTALALILYLFLALVTGMAVSACDKISPKNGKVKLRSRGRIAYYNCWLGYQMIGEATATCVRGSWTSEPPICIPLGIFFFIFCVPPSLSFRGFFLRTSLRLSTWPRPPIVPLWIGNMRIGSWREGFPDLIAAGNLVVHLNTTRWKWTPSPSRHILDLSSCFGNMALFLKGGRVDHIVLLWCRELLRRHGCRAIVPSNYKKDLRSSSIRFDVWCIRFHGEDKK